MHISVFKREMLVATIPNDVKVSTDGVFGFQIEFSMEDEDDEIEILRFQ